MPKYLINDREAAALRKIVANNNASDNLDTDNKLSRPASNFPFRFKLLENMGASTASKASAAIYFLGDTTAYLYDTDDVVDNDSSQYASAILGDKGVCLASSQYSIISVDSAITSNTYRAQTLTGGVLITDMYSIPTLSAVASTTLTVHFTTDSTGYLEVVTSDGTIKTDVTGTYLCSLSASVATTDWLNSNNKIELAIADSTVSGSTTTVHTVRGMTMAVWPSTALADKNWQHVSASAAIEFGANAYIHVRNNTGVAIDIVDFVFSVKRLP